MKSYIRKLKIEQINKQPTQPLSLNLTSTHNRSDTSTTMLGRFSALIASTTLGNPAFSFYLPRRTLDGASSTISRHASTIPSFASLWRGILSLRSSDKSTRLHSSLSLESIAESLKTGRTHRVVVVAGAGVSCAAGIPDFRTPGSGL
jgi:hypothetical protein